uniref:(northern house mosquito) hypothetical protein n=1 Tax=Culex pipiens TaxID=7175 RepID=A0A8D8CDB6_CULPI
MRSTSLVGLPWNETILLSIKPRWHSFVRSAKSILKSCIWCNSSINPASLIKMMYFPHSASFVCSWDCFNSATSLELRTIKHLNSFGFKNIDKISPLSTPT